MDKIPISEFKATCLAVLDRVKRTGQPVLITRRGEPIAEVVPPAPEKGPKSWVGSRSGSGKIVGDIMAPVMDEADWKAIGS